jgi:hypothetical protein
MATPLSTLEILMQLAQQGQSPIAGVQLPAPAPSRDLGPLMPTPGPAPFNPAPVLEQPPPVPVAPINQGTIDRFTPIQKSATSEKAPAAMTLIPHPNRLVFAFLRFWQLDNRK